MVCVKGYGSFSRTQIAARKSLKKNIKRIREREYAKLRDLVPAVANRKKVSKIEVVEEATRYIIELRATLIERFRLKHGIHGDKMAEEAMQTFVEHVMEPFCSQSHLVNFEKKRKLSNYPLTKKSKTC